MSIFELRKKKVPWVRSIRTNTNTSRVQKRITFVRHQIPLVLQLHDNHVSRVYSHNRLGWIPAIAACWSGRKAGARCGNTYDLPSHSGAFNSISTLWLSVTHDAASLCHLTLVKLTLQSFTDTAGKGGFQGCEMLLLIINDWLRMLIFEPPSFVGRCSRWVGCNGLCCDFLAVKLNA